ncbi:hypothetical protein CBER1_11908 [Cercospora berteroae]|uniref:Rhodopsin domain-containing protein n=1 Tax=Cercospora berteroae TaxID=357750 RepID=A0A2S6CH24_9PEZI|nr:hypothetical protein CBER1_11908 [Cercospora berteroae]
MVFSWVTLALRLWVRKAIIGNLAWDDAFLVAGALSFNGFCITLIIPETPYGGALRVHELTFPEISRLTLIIISGFTLYVATMIFLKTSLGIFYLRIVIRNWQRHLVYFVLSFNALWGICLFFLALFQCGSNVSKYLENTIKDICLPVPVAYRIQLAAAYLNAVTDWIFAILPIFVLVKATMPMRTKLSAGFVLTLGCCGSIISLARISYIKGIRPGPNFFQTAVELGSWSIAELGLIIIAASIATLRPLLRIIRRQVRLASLRRKGGSNNTSIASASPETAIISPPPVHVTNGSAAVETLPAMTRVDGEDQGAVSHRQGPGV